MNSNTISIFGEYCENLLDKELYYLGRPIKVKAVGFCIRLTRIKFRTWEGAFNDIVTDEV